MTSIYFAKCGENIKIGIASDVRKRLSNLQSSAPDAVLLLGSSDGEIHIEEKLHRHLHQYRIRGEWYRDCEPVRNAMMQFLETGEVPPSPAHPLTLYRNSYTPPITRAELAVRLGVAPSSVTRWERGERRPDGTTLTRIVSVTGIKPQALRPDLAELMQSE